MLEHAVGDPDADVRAVGVGVLHDVRQRLGHDEVGARLDLGRQALLEHVHADGHARAGHDRFDARSEAASGQDRGKESVGQLAQLGVGLLRLLERLADEAP